MLRIIVLRVVVLRVVGLRPSSQNSYYNLLLYCHKTITYYNRYIESLSDVLVAMC